MFFFTNRTTLLFSPPLFCAGGSFWVSPPQKNEKFPFGGWPLFKKTNWEEKMGLAGVWRAPHEINSK